jgi:RNA polymerase sigma factor (sigma-70 family)
MANAGAQNRSGPARGAVAPRNVQGQTPRQAPTLLWCFVPLGVIRRKTTKTTRTVSITVGNHRDRVRARRDELVEQHLSLVEGIARGVHRSLPPCFDLDDLIGVGNIALVHAATSFRPRAHPGVPFAAWARLRVRGAILDECCPQTWRGKPSKQWRENTRVGIDEIRQPATAPVTDERIDAARRTRRLREAISWLPAAQQRVLYGYYARHEPTMVEVATQLGVSVSVVSELHSAAVEGLRQRFKRAA